MADYEQLVEARVETVRSPELRERYERKSLETILKCDAVSITKKLMSA